MAAWITESLLDSLRNVESGGNRFAVSKAGAKGPYQFMDGTAKDMGLDDPFDEVKSRAAARKYLTQLSDRFGGNQVQALTAYNWGMGNLGKLLRTGTGNMPTEARQYAGKVLGNKMDYFDQLQDGDVSPMVMALRGQKPQPRSTSLSQRPDGPPPATNLPNPVMNSRADEIARYQGQAGEAIGRANAMMDESPDLAQWQEFAKKRASEGGQHLMLALAAQNAGKGFEPISAMYLKQAMAAQDPLQVGKAGMITADGEFVADPFHQKQQKIEMLDRRAAHYERLAQTAQTAEDRAQAAELARQDRLAYQQMMGGIAQGNLGVREQQLRLQREIVDQRELDRRAKEADREDRSKSGNAAQIDKIGSQVYDDYHKNNKDDILTVNAHQRLKATAQKADAASDISFIFQYMKMLDPTSVVREGEFATAQNATGVPDRVFNMYNRALKGERLNPEQRAQFLSTAERLAADSEARLGQSRSVLERRLRAAGADPEIYLPGWKPAASAAPAAPGGSGTAGTPIRAPQQPQIFRGM